MANHTPGPWYQMRKYDHELCGDRWHISQEPNGGPYWIAELFGQLPDGHEEANAHLISRAPSMLALLEKAYPIIEDEADRRGSWGERHNAQQHQYATEMRDLANEISAEIDRAHGREVLLPDPELCPHGYGFVEYCEDCNQKEIKAKWREKEDSHG